MWGRETDEIAVYATSFGIKAASGECWSCQSNLFLLNPVSTIRNALHHSSHSCCRMLIACSSQEDLTLTKQESSSKVLPTYLWQTLMTQNTAKPGESFHLPLHSACTKPVFCGFALRAYDGSKDAVAWDAALVPTCSLQRSCWVCTSFSVLATGTMT